MVMATAKEEPELIPNNPASANPLRKRLWIAAPQIASDEPTSTANRVSW